MITGNGCASSPWGPRRSCCCVAVASGCGEGWNQLCYAIGHIDGDAVRDQNKQPWMAHSRCVDGSSGKTLTQKVSQGEIQTEITAPYLLHKLDVLTKTSPTGKLQDQVVSLVNSIKQSLPENGAERDIPGSFCGAGRTGAESGKLLTKTPAESRFDVEP